MTAGIEHEQREQIIEILRNPPTGRTPADLVQLLDLKKIIDELSRLADGYEKRSWRDIDGNSADQVREFRGQYLRLHRQVVEYFERVRYGSFSMSDLERYASIQERLIEENDAYAIIEAKRNARREVENEIQRRRDFYHKVAAQVDQIKQLHSFNLQKAQEYGSGLVRKRTDMSGEVSEHEMRAALSEGSYSDPAYLHGVWFLAKLFIQQEPKRIEGRTDYIKDLAQEIYRLRTSLGKVSHEERDALTAFKKGRGPKYSAQSYQVAYNEWCIVRFRQIFR